MLPWSPTPQAWVRLLPLAAALPRVAGCVLLQPRAVPPPALPGPLVGLRIRSAARARVPVVALVPARRLPHLVHRRLPALIRPRRFRPPALEPRAARRTPVTGFPCRPCLSTLPAGLRLPRPGHRPA